jgi:hypothetical protein
MGNEMGEIVRNLSIIMWLLGIAVALALLVAPLAIWHHAARIDTLLQELVLAQRYRAEAAAQSAREILAADPPAAAAPEVELACCPRCQTEIPLDQVTAAGKCPACGIGLEL